MDLRSTLIRNEIKQVELANAFDVSEQLVSFWVNKSLPKPWERLIKQYIINKGGKIIEKEKLKNS